MIKKVFKQEHLVAIIIDFLADFEATTFFTDKDSFLQVGLIHKESLQSVKPHRHNVFERRVLGTSEFLFVLEGKMAITIFDSDFKSPETFTLGKGSGVLLVGGSHSINFAESAKLIEVKQGPFFAEEDKVYLTEIDS